VRDECIYKFTPGVEHTIGAGKAESRRCLCAFRERRYLSRKTYLEIESAGAGLWIATQL